MGEITKAATIRLYETALKQEVSLAFETAVKEMAALNPEVYVDYATSTLKNLIQLSAKGVSDLNVIITEDLHQSETLYGEFEKELEEIRCLDGLLAQKKVEKDALFETYQMKKAAYESQLGASEKAEDLETTVGEEGGEQRE